MTKKKIYTSVTATAFIASSLFVADQVDASTYNVQPGDTLWSIAQNHQTTVSHLKSINQLKDDLIFPNQTLLTAASDEDASDPSEDSETKEKEKSPATYVVKRGDTLSEIAFAHKIRLADLMKWNNLDTTLIYPGDVLIVRENHSHTDNPSEDGEDMEQTEEKVEDAQEEVIRYTVQAGDTLSAIARDYKVTVADLKRWNKLNSDLILIGQSLIVSNASLDEQGNPENTNDHKENEQQEKQPKEDSTNNDTEETATIHVVEKGDTLSSIAKKYGVTVQNLKDWNYLATDFIIIGEELKVSEGASETIDETYEDDFVTSLVDQAKSLVGSGYVWGGNSPAGFDCSGFIYYTFNRAGMDIPRLSTEGYYSRSYYVDKPQVGDLVFFENTYKQGISHMGIYLGNDEFVHAGSSGVTISNLNTSYWKERYDGFKRFY